MTDTDDEMLVANLEEHLQDAARQLNELAKRGLWERIVAWWQGKP